MNTILQIDVSDVVEKMNEFSCRVSPGTFEKVYRYTFRDVGKAVKTVADPLIRKEYRAKSRKIKSAFKTPIISTSGQIVLMVPVSDIRGKIGKKGMFNATSGPGAQIVTAGNSLLPTKGSRVHFYVSSGRLAGHMFVRHNDGKVWRGTRRQQTKEAFQDSLGRNRTRKTGEVKEYGTRKRVGSITHAVGIGVPQMPMNRAADEVQSAVLTRAHQRFEHYARRALSGGI